MEILLLIINYQQENNLGWYVKMMKDLHIQNVDLAKLIMLQRVMFFFKA